MTAMVPIESDTAEPLIAAIQDLSLARDLETLMAIVRRAARRLTGADGATFVLKDGKFCWYADEDAIAPLWKGSRFPISECISGWVMVNRQPVVIPDIYDDPRVPAKVYRPTFVKSLAMVPIRPSAPIAAIGNYWSVVHHATEREVGLLQALANSTSVAMENIELYSELERRVQSRTAELAVANRQLAETNRELEAFAYTASHDLRAPLRTIQGFARLLAEDQGNQITRESRRYLDRVERASQRMDDLIRDLLSLARFSTAAVNKERVDLTGMADEILRGLMAEASARRVSVKIAGGADAFADPGLIRIVLENLLGNAWKFTSNRSEAVIEFGFSDSGGEREFFVRDNGAGFAPDQTSKLFAPFQRLHTASEFPGVGIGLATVRRIISRHGGGVRAEGSPNHGATFRFTLPPAPDLNSR